MQTNILGYNKFVLINYHKPPGNCTIETSEVPRQGNDTIEDVSFVNIILVGDFKLSNLDFETFLPPSNAVFCHNYDELLIEVAYLLNFLTHRLGNWFDSILNTMPSKFI